MNSVVVGATVGLGVNFFAEPDLAVSLGVGVLTALLAVLAHMRYQSRAWKEALLATPTQFPRQADPV